MSIRSNFWTKSLVHLPLLCIGMIWFSDIYIFGTTICDVSQRHIRNTHNVSLVFKDISKFSEIQNVLQDISASAKAIPDRVIYLNKRLLMNQLGLLNLQLQEVSSYALRFLDDLSEFYNSRQKKISDVLIRQRLRQRWETLMFSMLLEASYPEDLGFNLDDIIRCERTNPLVLHTVDVIGERRYQWNQHFINGIKHYIWLQQMIELAGSTVAVGPSVSCHLHLNRLVVGCSTTASSSFTDSFSSTASSSTEFASKTNVSQVPCFGYCQNVIRGCLAPPLLFLPIHAINTESTASPYFPSSSASNPVSVANLWQMLLSSPEGRPGTSYIQNTFDTLLSSLSAAHLSELIKQGLETARREISARKSRFKLLCKDRANIPGPLAPSVPPSEVRTPRQTESLLPVVADDLESERRNLLQQIQLLQDRLIKLAKDRMNAVRLIELAERRYCLPQDKVDPLDEKDMFCWNGSTFGNYTKPVPPFTIDGQKQNPEINLTAIDLYPARETEQTKGDKNRSEQTDSLQSDIHSQIADVDRFSSETGDDALWNQDMSASSGFRPIVSDIGFVPDLRPPIDQSPTIDADLVDQEPPNKTSNQTPDAAAGCSPDDEDCAAEFTDVNSLKPSDSEPQRSDLMFDNVSTEQLHHPPSVSESLEQAQLESELKSVSLAEPDVDAQSASIKGAKSNKKNQSSRLLPTFIPMIFVYLNAHYLLT